MCLWDARLRLAGVATVLGGLNPAPLNVEDLVGRCQLKRLLGQVERRVGRSPRVGVPRGRVESPSQLRVGPLRSQREMAGPLLHIMQRRRQPPVDQTPFRRRVDEYTTEAYSGWVK